MATVLWLAAFYIWGAHWCDLAVHMRRRCSLMSNYFDHLLLVVLLFLALICGSNFGNAF